MTESTDTSPRAADTSALGLIAYSVTVLVLAFGASGIVKEPDGAAFFAASALVTGIVLVVLAFRAYAAGDGLLATGYGANGLLWLSWWGIAHEGGGASDIHKTDALFLLFWAVVALFVALAHLKAARGALLVWATWFAALLFLALGQFQNGAAPDGLTKVGGYLALVSGLLALYSAGATIVNAAHDKPLLPTL